MNLPWRSHPEATRLGRRRWGSGRGVSAESGAHPPDERGGTVAPRPGQRIIAPRLMTPLPAALPTFGRQGCRAGRADVIMASPDYEWQTATQTADRQAPSRCGGRRIADCDARVPLRGCHAAIAATLPGSGFAGASRAEGGRCSVLPRPRVSKAGKAQALSKGHRTQRPGWPGRVALYRALGRRGARPLGRRSRGA